MLLGTMILSWALNRFFIATDLTAGNSTLSVRLRFMQGVRRHDEVPVVLVQLSRDELLRMMDTGSMTRAAEIEKAF